MNRLQWCASLSDGTNAQEGVGDYQVLAGEPSPWQRLLAFASTNGLTITSLSLRCGDLSWNLPSAGRNPKFRAFAGLPRPKGYRFFRKAAVDFGPGGQAQRDELAVICADYQSHSVQLWVDEANLASWTMTAPPAADRAAV